MALPEAKKLLALLHQAWSINSAGHLERVFLLKNFIESLALAQKLGEIAERAGHHPDLLVSYGQLRAEIWTHKINGLSRADFVLAAKIDEVVHEHV
jgi:4a-hydroxytetrahydrobiopterin dehydratase